MARATDLLQRIEEGALDSGKPLADTLRLCVALGGHAGSADLRDWARKELDGYAPDDELPGYRIVSAPILIDGTTFNAIIRGQQLAPSEIPDFAQEQINGQVRLSSSVTVLEDMARKVEAVQIQHDGMPDLVRIMNSEMVGPGAIHRMYWSVQPVVLGGVVSQIRTALVAIVAELRAAGATGAEAVTADVAQQAVNVVVHNAPRGNVTVNSAVTASGDAAVTVGTNHESSRLPAWIRGPWGFAVSAATIVAGYASVAVAKGWPPF